jgi:hypothetical protein
MRCSSRAARHVGPRPEQLEGLFRLIDIGEIVVDTRYSRGDRGARRRQCRRRRRIGLRKSKQGGDEQRQQHARFVGGFLPGSKPVARIYPQRV